MSSPSPRPVLVVAVTELILALLLVVGIWVTLPARWWPVDPFGTGIAALHLLAGAALLFRQPWARTLAREVRRGSSFLCTEDPRLHFGVGAADAVDVTVRWPDGATTTLVDVPTDASVRARQGDAVAFEVLP